MDIFHTPLGAGLGALAPKKSPRAAAAPAVSAASSRGGALTTSTVTRVSTSLRRPGAEAP